MCCSAEERGGQTAWGSDVVVIKAGEYRAMCAEKPGRGTVKETDNLGKVKGKL